MQLEKMPIHIIDIIHLHHAPDRAAQKKWDGRFSLPVQFHRLPAILSLVAVVYRVGDDEMIVAEDIRGTGNRKSVIVIRNDFVGFCVGDFVVCLIRCDEGVLPRAVLVELVAGLRDGHFWILSFVLPLDDYIIIDSARLYIQIPQFIERTQTYRFKKDSTATIFPVYLHGRANIGFALWTVSVSFSCSGIGKRAIKQIGRYRPAYPCRAGGAARVTYFQYRSRSPFFCSCHCSFCSC